MTGALVSTALMSVGAVAIATGAPPLLPFLAYAAALLALIALAGRHVAVPERSARWLVAASVVAVVAFRHLFVTSSGVAPDHVLAGLVVLGAAAAPRGARWDALGVAAALATYAVTAAILIAVQPYRSDAVVSAHGAADLLLAGQHPYASFDLVAQLARFGLPPEYSTALEDGTRVRSLQYPALAFLLPAAPVALGLADLRALYLAEVLAVFGLVLRAVPAAARAPALALCLGNFVVLTQFVLAGVDPLFGLLILVAWLGRHRRASALALGLAIAARQQAWLVAPFLVVWTWHRLGPREALVRAGAAAAVALALHLPFLATAPGAVAGGLLDSALQPHEPWGIGIAKLLADAGLGGLVPRPAYLALAGGAYLAALGLYAARRAAPGGPLVVALVPLWFGWRALQSYFAFLPLFAAASERARGTTGNLRSMPVDKELLEILACPVDHAAVREEGERLICQECGRRYPVRDGIPVMLVEEAEQPR